MIVEGSQFRIEIVRFCMQNVLINRRAADIAVERRNQLFQYIAKHNKQEFSPNHSVQIQPKNNKIQRNV